MRPEIVDMIARHAEGTRICSVPGHMRRASPTYNAIMALGEDAFPEILTYLRDAEHAGMNVLLLLMDQVKEHPYKPESVAGGHMAAFTVADAKKAWLAWGTQHGYLKG